MRDGPCVKGGRGELRNEVIAIGFYNSIFYCYKHFMLVPATVYINNYDHCCALILYFTSGKTRSG